MVIIIIIIIVIFIILIIIIIIILDLINIVIIIIITIHQTTIIFNLSSRLLSWRRHFCLTCCASCLAAALLVSTSCLSLAELSVTGRINQSRNPRPCRIIWLCTGCSLNIVVFFQEFSKLCSLSLAPVLGCYWSFWKWPANRSDCTLLRVGLLRAGDGLQWIGKKTQFSMNTWYLHNYRHMFIK